MRRTATFTLVTALLALIGGAGRAADLTIGMATSPTALDPHYHLLATNMSIDAHVFETLVKQDASQAPTPGLATAWRLVDPLTWEFTLRKDVVFSDGSPFTADDVAFSLKRVSAVPNSPSSFAVYTRTVASWDIPDPYTIRLHTKAPTPDLPLSMSLVFIMSHTAAAGPVAEGKTTDQLNSGNGLVGTGPYRYKSYLAGDRVVFTRNEQYWGGREPWDNVTILFQSNTAARLAAVLAGQTDVAEKLSGEGLDAVRASSRMALVTTPSNSVTYIVLEQAREPSPGVSDSGGRNPLRDPKVRQALSLALNREGIARQVMSGLAIPAAAMAAGGMVGVDPSVPPEPYNPNEAKRLLAEAGWGNGFALTLATTNGAYVQDAQLAQAIAAMWTRVGVRTSVDAVPAPVFYAHRNSGELSAFVTSSSIMTGQASDLLNIYAATRNPAKGVGMVNYSGFSNPTVDELLEHAATETDAAKRAALLQQANRIVFLADHAMLPVFVEKLAYGVRRPLTFMPRVDKWVTAMQVRDPTKPAQ